nr:hypothetical protein [Tanacetum cinerariifolium]
MLVQVYVDDIIFGSTNKSWCDEFKELMKNRFQMSSMGELTFFFGFQVKQKEDDIFISQDKYVATILKWFDFLSVKTASTPIETQKPLVKDEEVADVDVHLYRYLKGQPKLGLWYPKASLFNREAYSDSDYAVKRIFRYLKGQPKLGLWYPKVSTFDLEAYSDSDYAGANLDRKSTTGGCQFLTRRLISWQCKKQTIVATSTTEAEYVDVAHCCGQVLMIQNQLLDYGDAYEKKLIQVLKIHTDDNVADLLTKAFDVSSNKALAILEQTAAGNDEIFAALANMGYEKISDKITFYKAFFSPYLGDMSHHQDIYDNPSLNKKVFANIKRVGTGFSRVITPLFENMLVPVVEEIGQAQDNVSIPTEPSTSKPHKKHNPRNNNQKHLSLKFQELMDLCTKLSNKVLDLESEVIDIKSSFTDKIEKLEDRVHKLEEENRILKETSFKSAKIDIGSLKKSNKNVISPKNVIGLLVNVSLVMNRLVGVNGL